MSKPVSSAYSLRNVAIIIKISHILNSLMYGQIIIIQTQKQNKIQTSKFQSFDKEKNDESRKEEMKNEIGKKTKQKENNMGSIKHCNQVCGPRKKKGVCGNFTFIEIL